MYGIAAVVPPLMGGAFTTHLTWQWCFLINLPIGAAAMAATAFCLRLPPRREVITTWRKKMAQMDLLGTTVLVPGIVCLLLALQLGGSVHAWTNATLVCLLAAMDVAAVCSIGIQIWKQDEGTVPPRIIEQRSVACRAIYLFCAGGALNVFQSFLPIWFQAIKGMTPFDSGTRILPMTLGTVVFSLIAGFGASRCGYYTPFMIVRHF